MIAEILYTFPTPKILEIIHHLETQSDHLKEDISNYAPGRLRYWLHQEPDLRSGRNGSPVQYRPAIHDERLWPFIKQLVPSASCALVAKGTGINWHRDASYAHKTAHILNLGSATFQIAVKRNSDSPPALYDQLILTGGELIQFDCKHLHRSIAVANDRWMIGIWQPK